MAPWIELSSTRYFDGAASMPCKPLGFIFLGSHAVAVTIHICTYFRTKRHTTTIVHGSNFKSAPIRKLFCNSIASTPQIPAHHQIPTTSLIILIPSENCAPSSPLHRVHPPLCYLPPSCTTHGIKTIRYLPHTRRTHGCLGRSSGRAI